MTKQELEVNLLTLLKGKCKILIITYENTDPDGIAAASAQVHIPYGRRILLSPQRRMPLA